MWQDNKNDHTHNLLNLLNAFVNVQLHMLGDPPKCSTGECYSDKGERNLVFLMPSQPWWLYQSVRQKYMLPDWNIANKPRALYVPWEEHLIYRLRTNTSNYLTTLPNERPAQMVPTSFPGVIRALPPTFIFFIALQGHLFQTPSKAKHKHEKKKQMKILTSSRRLAISLKTMAALKSLSLGEELVATAWIWCLWARQKLRHCQPHFLDSGYHELVAYKPIGEKQF